MNEKQLHELKEANDEKQISRFVGCAIRDGFLKLRKKYVVIDLKTDTSFEVVSCGEMNKLMFFLNKELEGND